MFATTTYPVVSDSIEQEIARRSAKLFPETQVKILEFVEIQEQMEYRRKLTDGTRDLLKNFWFSTDELAEINAFVATMATKKYAKLGK